MDHWFWAPSAVSAPSSDLQFIKKIQSYHDIDSKTASSAVKAISSHLWCLIEHPVGLDYIRWKKAGNA